MYQPPTGIPLLNSVSLLTLYLVGKFSCVLQSADYFQNQNFRKILSGIPSECQTVWIQIRTFEFELSEEGGKEAP